MEIDVRGKEKCVYICLTHGESQNAGLKESLKELYKEYKAKKYLVAVFESGTEDLQESIRNLLNYNKTCLRELEMKKWSNREIVLLTASPSRNIVALTPA